MARNAEEMFEEVRATMKGDWTQCDNGTVIGHVFSPDAERRYSVKVVPIRVNEEGCLCEAGTERRIKMCQYLDFHKFRRTEGTWTTRRTSQTG